MARRRPGHDRPRTACGRNAVEVGRRAAFFISRCKAEGGGKKPNGALAGRRSASVRQAIGEAAGCLARKAGGFAMADVYTGSSPARCSAQSLQRYPTDEAGDYLRGRIMR